MIMKITFLVSLFLINTDSSPMPRSCPGCDEVEISGQEALQESPEARSEDNPQQSKEDDPWDLKDKPQISDRKQMFWNGVWDTDKTARQSHEGSLHHADHHDPLVMLEKTANRFPAFTHILNNALNRKRRETQMRMENTARI